MHICQLNYFPETGIFQGDWASKANGKNQDWGGVGGEAFILMSRIMSSVNPCPPSSRRSGAQAKRAGKIVNHRCSKKMLSQAEAF